MPIRLFVKSFPRHATSIAAALLLAACGGGGGGADAPAAPVSPVSPVSPVTPVTPEVPVPPVVATYLLGGTVSGLSAGATISLGNGDEKLTLGGNGSFTFATKVAVGAAYNVQALSSPQHGCTLKNNTATMPGADVTAVTVTCLPFLLAGKESKIQMPVGLAHGKDGSLFIADRAQQVIWKSSPAGVVTLLAGTPGVFGSRDGSAAQASFYMNAFSRILLDRDGSLLVGDTCNGLLRRVTMAGVVSTVAGKLANYCPVDQAEGKVRTPVASDGRGTAAVFDNVYGLELDNNGDYLVGGSSGGIRRVTPDGQVSTVKYTLPAGIQFLTLSSGNGSGGVQDMAVDANGDLVFIVFGNSRVWKIHAGAATVLAGSALSAGQFDGAALNATFSGLRAIKRDAAGNFFVSSAMVLRKITPDGTVSTLAGFRNTVGDVDGTGGAANFRTLGALSIAPDGSLALVDSASFLVRLVTQAGVASTAPATPLSAGYVDGKAGAARVEGYSEPAVDSQGNLYITDSIQHVIRKITPAGEVSLYAGRPGVQQVANAGRWENVDGPLLNATFNTPYAITIDANDRMYVAEQDGIRIISAGMVSTLANLPADIFAYSISVDGQGNIAFADGNSSAVYGVSAAGQVRVLVNEDSLKSLSLTGSVLYVHTVAFDGAGNLFIADGGYSVVYKLNQAGVLSVFAGTALAPGITDGAPGTGQLGFYTGASLAVDAGGNLYFSGQGRLRKISSQGVISTPALPWGDVVIYGMAYRKGVLYGMTKNAVLQLAVP